MATTTFCRKNITSLSRVPNLKTPIIFRAPKKKTNMLQKVENEKLLVYILHKTFFSLFWGGGGEYIT